MSGSNLINSIGLALDILGVVLIWRFGLPESLSRRGHTYIVTEAVDESEIAKARRYDRLSQCGLALVVLGFAVQLASNFIRT